MPDAVSLFERLRSKLRPRRVESVRAPTEVSDNFDVLGKKSRTPEPTDLIFPKWQSELFKTITEEENLRSDRDGRPRTAYSLRHTYISMPLMEGANIYQIAKNCRTSVGMIEKYYGVHIKNSLNAAAINVYRERGKPDFGSAADSRDRVHTSSSSSAITSLPRERTAGRTGICQDHQYSHGWASSVESPTLAFFASVGCVRPSALRLVAICSPSEDKGNINT
jgi:hypothetical protein